MFKKIKSLIKAFKLYSNTRKELNGLSDIELKDLGISRYDIPRLAKETVQEKKKNNAL